MNLELNEKLFHFEENNYFRDKSLNHEEKNNIIYEIVKSNLNTRTLKLKNNKSYSENLLMFYGFIITISIFRYFM
jgi:hypothetical protein